MKSLSVIFFFFIAAYCYGQKKKITLILDNVPVKQALDVLQTTSGMSLWLNTSDVNLNKMISINVKKESVEKVLEEILEGQDVTFEIRSNNIIISRRSSRSHNAMSGNTQKITGFVVDEAGNPLSNAVVRIKDRQNATQTNENGYFSIEISSSDKFISFSYLGMVNVELPATNEMHVKLIPAIKLMPELVITALGIKRDKKSLPYSTQSLDQDDISKERNVNIASTLSGNTAGIDVLQSAAGAGGSTKITLRGPKNITSTNQPLFVIDGVPLANYQTSDPYGFYFGRDSGDGISNINPDDIESLTILKGANAAALYGSQAANGVILISTKKGINGATKITLNSGISITQVAELPPLQFSYAQTESGSEDSWGQKGSYANHVKDFFNIGATYQHSITMSMGNDRITSYFSYGNTTSNGIMPTNRYVKNNFSFRQSQDFLNKRLNVFSNIMLTEEQLHNTILTGYYWNPLLGLYNFPRGLDFNYYKNNYQILNSSTNLMTQNWPITDNAEGEMNPYWILNNDPDDTKTRRFIGNLSLKYILDKGVEISAKGTYDYTNQLYTMRAMANSSSVLVSSNGRYIYSNLNSWQAYGEALISLNKSISSSFDLYALLGTCYQYKVIGDGLYIDSNVYGLKEPNVFTINNIASMSAFSSTQTIASRLIKESVFGNVSIGFKNRLFLDISGRNDWSSSLSFTDHLSYFYPSVGLSALINQFIALPKHISFLKARGSFAQVSNEIPSFITNPTGTVSATSYTGSFSKAFNDLRPEMVDNYEAGLEAKLLGNKLGVDFTIYQIENRNQYLQLDAPSGSGYTSYYINAGHIRTKGIEVTLNAKLIKNSSFSWNSTLNFSSNHNKILVLSKELTGYYTIPGGGEGYQMKVIAGGSMGDIYTYGFKKDSNGNLMLEENHVPAKTSSEQKIGSANPDWMLGLNNKIAYKNFSLTCIIDGKFGGKFVSMTQSYLDLNGVTKATADARDRGGVFVSGTMSDGTSWSGQVDAKTYYTGISGRNGIMENYVYDATNVRLRKCILGYSIGIKNGDKKLNIDLSLIGTNLFFIYKKAPADPNTTISMGNGTQAVENFGLPRTRSFMFNIQINI